MYNYHRPSWLTFKLTLELASCQRTQAVRKSYSPHVAHGYRVRLQRQKHTEQCMPDVYIYIYMHKFYNFEVVCAQVKASLYPQPLNVVSTLCLGENLLLVSLQI